MKKNKSIANRLILLAVILFAAVSVSAGTYVSPKGKFHITYPANWKQIDYGTLDMFLSMHQAGEDALNYDAAFADSSVIPFFSGTYVIMTVDSTILSGQKQIDSVLEEMHKVFGADIRYFPVADLTAQQKTNSPTYDSTERVITVVSDVVEGEQVIKKHVYMRKFYDKGTADFFFYTPDSLFQSALPLFQQIVGSLSTENLEAATPKEEVKVADIENRDIQKGDGSESKLRSSLPFFGGGLFAVVVILIIRMRRKRAEQARK